MTELQSQSTHSTDIVMRIEKDSFEVKAIEKDITETILLMSHDLPFRDFIADMILSDIRENLDFYASTSDPDVVLFDLDPLNGLFVPVDQLLCKVLPVYVNILISSGFELHGGIRGLLNDIASVLQDDLERRTISASEEEFKDKTYAVKTTDEEVIADTIKKHTNSSKVEEFPLEECHVCGNEEIHTYYSCQFCEYAFCADCCKNIASRQAICPCCSKEFSLMFHQCESV